MTDGNAAGGSARSRLDPRGCGAKRPAQPLSTSLGGQWMKGPPAARAYLAKRSTLCQVFPGPWHLVGARTAPPSPRAVTRSSHGGRFGARALAIGTGLPLLTKPIFAPGRAIHDPTVAQIGVALRGQVTIAASTVAAAANGLSHHTLAERVVDDALPHGPAPLFCPARPLAPTPRCRWGFGRPGGSYPPPRGITRASGSQRVWERTGPDAGL